MAETTVTVKGKGDDGRDHAYEVKIDVDEDAEKATITVKRDDESTGESYTLEQVKRSGDGQTITGRTTHQVTLLKVPIEVAIRVTIAIVCPHEATQDGHIGIQVEYTHPVTRRWQEYKKTTYTITPEAQANLVAWMKDRKRLPGPTAL